MFTRAALCSALLVTLVLAPSPASAASTPCQKFAAFSQAGTLGSTGSPNAAIGISGLAVSKFNNSNTVAGPQIAWGVGDRSANAIGPDPLYLFGFNAHNGKLAIKYPLNGPFPDPITKGGLPDVEELSMQYVSQQPGTIWLLDTGDNNLNRTTVNAYSVTEPDLTTDSRWTSDPSLNWNATGAPLTVRRYPITVPGAPMNIEAGFIDSTSPTGQGVLYLIPKEPITTGGQRFSVFKVQLTNRWTMSNPTAMNTATNVSSIDLGAPGLHVDAASETNNGTAFVVRGGVGGTPGTDRIGFWSHTPSQTIEAQLDAKHGATCALSFNSSPNLNVEETIAFDLAPVGSAGYDGLVWTHDASGAAPYYSAPST
jgi:hypothetical protein